MEDETRILERRIETWMNDATKGVKSRNVRLVARWNELKKACDAVREAAKEGGKKLEESVQAARLAQAMLEQEAESYAFEIERMEAHAAAERLDKERYRAECERLEERDRAFVQEIEEKKAMLKRAREEQALALELDELRKKCAELPSRAETEARIREVDAEIEAAEEEKRALEAMITSKSKQYGLAVFAMNELAEIFDTTIAGEEGEEEGEGVEEDESADGEEGNEQDQAKQGHVEEEDCVVPMIED